MNKKRATLSDRIFEGFVTLILVIFAAVILLPFLNIVSLSVSNELDIMANKVTFFPIGFSLASYEKILQTTSILRAYINTILIAVLGCIGSLLFTCLAAYPLAFGKFDGKKFYSVLLMFTLWFSGGMIPTFMVMNNLKLTNSLGALVVIHLFNAYHVLVLRSFFSGIPKSLVESAQIDGANDFAILFKIILPISKAALATLALWIIVMHWNDYMTPLIYLRDYKKFTLQIVLRDILISAEASSLFDITDGNKTAIPEQLKHAVIVVSMIPMLIIYPFAQKYFVKGTMLGAVKE